MDARYIDCQSKLEELVKDLEGSELLAIDTEFLREKSYYAKLCLIQVNNGEVQALIDPLACKDLKVLAPILRDEHCMKIFHAGTQDIDILLHACGVTPHPLFDTQVAAALLGFPLQIGYGPLVKGMCGVHLAKADSYTDWSRRPLSKNQLKYALDDVVYLPDIYCKMRDRLLESDRLRWLDSEFERLADPERYEADSMEAWHKVKRVSSLSRQQLSVAREIASWRELEARRRDLPRKWILPDEALVEIARKSPSSIDRLMEVRGLSGKLNTKSARIILEAVKRGRSLPEDEWPRLERRAHGTPEVEGVVDMMAAIVDVRARKENVAPPVLASRDDLTSLARGHRDDSPVLQGWRYEMVGHELVDLLDGKLALFVKDGAIEVMYKGQ